MLIVFLIFLAKRPQILAVIKKFLEGKVQILIVNKIQAIKN